MEWMILLKCLCTGLSAIAFAVLFNVPERTLISIFFISFLGGLIKFIVLQTGMNLPIATLISAMIIGSVSIPVAHQKHAPPLVFAIPSVIPMVPGIFAYRMILGLVKLSGDLSSNQLNQVLYETANNGLKVMFILLSLSGGVAFPMLLMRKDSVKYVKLFKSKASSS